LGAITPLGVGKAPTVEKRRKKKTNMHKNNTLLEYTYCKLETTIFNIENSALFS